MSRLFLKRTGSKAGFYEKRPKKMKIMLAIWFIT